MAFCGKCGSQVQDGVRFCPTCGNDLAAPAAPIQPPPPPQQQYQQAPPQQQYQQAPPQQQYQQPYQQAPPANDAEANKGMAILAYIIFFIPLLAGTHKTSPFVKFHTNQGIIAAIFSVGLSIVLGILSGILLFIVPFLVTILSLLYFAPLVLVIIGIINASKGEMKPLPIIGKFTILK